VEFLRKFKFDRIFLHNSDRDSSFFNNKKHIARLVDDKLIQEKEKYIVLVFTMLFNLV